LPPSENEYEATGKDVIKCLRACCEIDKGVTLRDIFLNVARNKELYDFIMRYTWCGSIDVYHSLLNTKEDPDEDAICLELGWYAEIHNHNDYQDFDTVVSFGVKAKIDEEDRDQFDGQETMTFGLLGSNVSKVLDLPVVVENKGFVIFYEDDKMKKVEKDRVFSLLDVLDGIYWEIGYHGSPEETEELYKEMKERQDEIIKAYENDDLESVGCISAEEMMEQMDRMSKVYAAIDEMVQSQSTIYENWDDIYDIIKSNLDFEPEFDEEDMERIQKYWLNREIRKIMDYIDEDLITDKTIYEFKKIIFKL
jgi:hypothetical protein